MSYHAQCFRHIPLFNFHSSPAERLCAFPVLQKLRSGDEIHNTETARHVGSLSLHSDRGGCSRHGVRPLQRPRGVKERACSKDVRCGVQGAHCRVERRACLSSGVTCYEGVMTGSPEPLVFKSPSLRSPYLVFFSCCCTRWPREVKMGPKIRS